MKKYITILFIVSSYLPCLGQSDYYKFFNKDGPKNVIYDCNLIGLSSELDTSISKETISMYSITIPNNKYSIEEYGEIAKNELIIIQSKKYFKFITTLIDKNPTLAKEIDFMNFNYKNYSFKLNGKIISNDIYEQLMKINVDRIKSVKYRKRKHKPALVQIKQVV